MPDFQPVKELSRDKFLTPDECARFCSAPKKNSLLGVRDYAILKVFLKGLVPMMSILPMLRDRNPLSVL